MHNLAERLEKRGWDRKEIVKAFGIIRDAKHNNSTLFLQKRIYWILLLILIAANFAISAALMPALIALRGFFLYFIIAVVAVGFGLLFEILIRSIEHLEKKHHLLLVFLIPIIALANIFFISNLSNRLINELNLGNMHNSITIAVVYAASFVLPYLISRFVLKIGYYSKE